MTYLEFWRDRSELSILNEYLAWEAEVANKETTGEQKEIAMDQLGQMCKVIDNRGLLPKLHKLIAFCEKEGITVG